MTAWEYKIVPAPRRGTKSKGAKTTEDRFALTLEELMNSYGAQGWEFLRSEALPVEERKGFTGKAVTTQHMLVFRRARPQHHVAPSAPVMAAPTLGPAKVEPPAPVVSFDKAE